MTLKELRKKYTDIHMERAIFDASLTGDAKYFYRFEYYSTEHGWIVSEAGSLKALADVLKTLAKHGAIQARE